MRLDPILLAFTAAIAACALLAVAIVRFVWVDESARRRAEAAEAARSHE